jgi:hypothetical protein
MTDRERKLMLGLGVLAAGGVAAGAYTLVLDPIQANDKLYADLQDQLSAKESQVTALQKAAVRLKTVAKRSLPANPDDARREYEAALGRLMVEADVPHGYTITPKQVGDVRTIPLLEGGKPGEAKKPAYTRIGFEIRMKKVDLPKLTKFLEGYYGLNLLQQITYFELKRDDGTTMAGRKPGALLSAADRGDLEVLLVTEAAILDGAENRRTLLTVPAATGAAAGGAGYAALQLSPAVGRGLRPLDFGPVLSTAGRSYLALAAKDVYHGPLPPPPPPPVAAAPPPPPAPTPKDDIAPYIKLTDITRRSDGTAEVHIRDAINNQDYQIDLRPRAERLEVRVQKFLYANGKRKRTELVGEDRELTYLAIREDEASTDRSFQVVGLLDDGLVLTEKVTAAPKADDDKKKDAPKGGGRRPATGERAKPATPVAPAVAVAGGPAASPATEERVFVWRAGQTLASLQPLPPDDAKKAMQTAAPLANPSLSRAE